MPLFMSILIFSQGVITRPQKTKQGPAGICAEIIFRVSSFKEIAPKVYIITKQCSTIDEGNNFISGQLDILSQLDTLRHYSHTSPLMISLGDVSPHPPLDEYSTIGPKPQRSTDTIAAHYQRFLRRKRLGP